MASTQSSSQRERDACGAIYIRCLGKHDEMKHYIVFDSDNSKSSTNLYKIRVEENQQQAVILEYDTEEKLFISSGGLMETTEEMKVSHCRNKSFKYLLDDHKLASTEEPNSQTSVNWCWNLDNIYLTEYMVKDQLTGAIVGKIGGAPKSAAVVLNKFRDDVIANQEKIGIFIMAALKVYYGILKYHKYPVPVGILSLMPSGMPASPDFSILKEMSKIKIRYSCRSKEMSQHFLDILDEKTHEIIMVVASTGSQRQEISFHDPYGIPQFTVLRHPETGISVMQNHLMKSFGLICPSSGVLSESADDASYMVFSKAEQSPSEQNQKNAWQIELIKYGNKDCAASFSREKETDIVSLSMSKYLELPKKALILGQAMLISTLYCKILSKARVPTILEYSYRKH